MSGKCTQTELSISFRHAEDVMHYLRGKCTVCTTLECSMQVFCGQLTSQLIYHLFFPSPLEGVVPKMSCCGSIDLPKFKISQYFPLHPLPELLQLRAIPETVRSSLLDHNLSSREGNTSCHSKLLL